MAVLRRDPVSGRVELLETVADSVTDRHLEKLAMSPYGHHFYLTDSEFGQPRISVFARLPGTGRLERRSEIVARRRSVLSQVAALQFDPRDGALIASGFENRPLTRLERDPASGALRFEARPNDAAEAIAGAQYLTLGPDGGHLYVTGSRGAVASFAWDDATGALLPRTAVYLTDPGTEALAAPIGFRLSPDGSRLYAMSEWGPLVTLALDDAGGLGVVGTFDPVDATGAPEELEISPDGAFLYLLGNSGIAVLSREAAPSEEGSEEPAPVQVFNQAETFLALDLSPDGRHLYALANLTCQGPFPCPAVVIFDRDPTSGKLTLRDSVSRLGYAIYDKVVVSPAGRHLYASSRREGTPVIATYARDPADGSLDLVEILGEVPDPEAPHHYENLTLAPDGRHLYATTTPDRALVVFARDLATGRLTLLDLPALAGADGVAVSPDSQLIFVADSAASTLTTLSRRCLTGASACTGGDRFRLDVAWRDFADRTGAATPLEPASDDSRIFWFFHQSNWEMLVKVLDGCAINDRFWVYAAATTDVETTLAVTDTWTGQRRTYFNPLGQAAPAVTDSAAFATCGAH